MAMDQMDQLEEGEFCKLKFPAYICSRLNIKSFVEGPYSPSIVIYERRKGTKRNCSAGIGKPYRYFLGAGHT